MYSESCSIEIDSRVRGEHFDKIVIVTDGYFELESDRPTVKNRDKVIFLYHEDHMTHDGFEEYLLSEVH